MLCFSIKKKAEDEQGSRNQRPTCSKDENKNRFFIDFLFFWKGACIFSLYPLLLLTATFRVAFGLIRPGGLWRKPSGS